MVTLGLLIYPLIGEDFRIESVRRGTQDNRKVGQYGFPCFTGFDECMLEGEDFNNGRIDRFLL